MSVNGVRGSDERTQLRLISDDVDHAVEDVLGRHVSWIARIPAPDGLSDEAVNE